MQLVRQRLRTQRGGRSDKCPAFGNHSLPFGRKISRRNPRKIPLHPALSTRVDRSQIFTVATPALIEARSFANAPCGPCIATTGPLQSSLPRSVRVRSLDLDHQRRRWMIVQGSVAMPARPMWLPRADLRRPCWRVHVAVTSSPSLLQVRLYAPRRFKSMCTSRACRCSPGRRVYPGTTMEHTRSTPIS